jgi:hypothetical protein
LKPVHIPWFTSLSLSLFFLGGIVLCPLRSQDQPRFAQRRYHLGIRHRHLRDSVLCKVSGLRSRGKAYRVRQAGVVGGWDVDELQRVSLSFGAWRGVFAGLTMSPAPSNQSRRAHRAQRRSPSRHPRSKGL